MRLPWRIPLISWILTILLLASPASAQEWEDLWNGSTLEGWHEIGEGDWEIVDGAIRGTHRREVEPYGHLVTDELFGDFDARFQFKSIRGNSGFYFRIEEAGFSGVSGFQAEVDPANDVGGLYETNGRQWVVQPAPELVRAWNRPGKWNEMQVSARGPLIQVKLNGHTTALIFDPESRRRGRIALQVHGQQDVEVWFRDLEIKRLSPRQASFESQSEEANALFERFFDEQLRMSPMNQSYLGLTWDQDEWDEVSEEHEREYVALVSRQLAELEREVDYDSLDAQARISYDLFAHDVKKTVEGFEYWMYDYPLNQMYGWQSTIPSFLINIHRVGSVEDARAYIARLRGVRGLIDQVIEKVDEQAEMELLPPRFVFGYVRDDSENILSGVPFDDTGDENVLLADFRKKVEALDIPNSEKEALIEDARSALVEAVGPAYRALIDRIDVWEAAATTDDGVWRFADGADFYDYRIRSVTTTDLSADEIHEIGLREVARIHDEMREIKNAVGFDGTLQEFFEFMREDPQFYYPNTPEGKEEYLQEATAMIDRMRSRLDDLFLRLPKADIVVKAVEPFREKSAGKAFYQRPAPDGSRPGVYYANLYEMSEMPIYQMEALAYHEGIPGHHMQIAIAQELEGLPRFRKYGGFTAYTEGWGLYSELVPKEIGFYEDPYSDFGRLAMELWRACRLVVDTGIHVKGWTREEAIDYLMENTPNPYGDVEKAIERYIVMPGQATAYKIGMLKIVELRERAEQALGEDFDLRTFHDVVLRNGAVPLSTLEATVDAWIAKGGG